MLEGGTKLRPRHRAPTQLAGVGESWDRVSTGNLNMDNLKTQTNESYVEIICTSRGHYSAHSSQSWPKMEAFYLVLFGLTDPPVHRIPNENRSKGDDPKKGVKPPMDVEPLMQAPPPLVKNVSPLVPPERVVTMWTLFLHIRGGNGTSQTNIRGDSCLHSVWKE